ncbi:phosphotransferase [Knoellia sp. S7-12]|uniref:phosphotransferase n=1 Tax=Knoellia sp. S7-12 TaxID=3126698 RepID=UPI0033683033
MSVLAAGDAPAYVLAAVAELEHLPADHPQAITAEVADRVSATSAQLHEDADVLGATGMPDSLQHNDLGDANVFIDGDRVRIFDLGDSFWSHPLPVLQVPLAYATGAWPLPEPEGPRVRPILLAYLSEWSDEPESLLGAWPAAGRLARVHRFASWARLVAEVPPEVVGDDLRLIDYLDPEPP